MKPSMLLYWQGAPQNPIGCESLSEPKPTTVALLRKLGALEAKDVK